jgi:hypothetical protein
VSSAAVTRNPKASAAALSRALVSAGPIELRISNYSTIASRFCVTQSILELSRNGISVVHSSAHGWEILVALAGGRDIQRSEAEIGDSAKFVEEDRP